MIFPQRRTVDKLQWKLGFCASILLQIERKMINWTNLRIDRSNRNDNYVIKLFSSGLASSNNVKWQTETGAQVNVWISSVFYSRILICNVLSIYKNNNSQLEVPTWFILSVLNSLIYLFLFESGFFMGAFYAFCSWSFLFYHCFGF